MEQFVKFRILVPNGNGQFDGREAEILVNPEAIIFIEPPNARWVAKQSEKSGMSAVGCFMVLRGTGAQNFEGQLVPVSPRFALVATWTQVKQQLMSPNSLLAEEQGALS